MPTKKRPSRKKAKRSATVTPLRKAGPLAPVRKRGVTVSFGIEDGDFVWRDADGTIERHKLTGEDDGE